MGGEFTDDANPRTKAAPAAGCELDDREIQVRDDTRTAKLFTDDSKTTITGVKGVQGSLVDQTVTVRGQIDERSTARNKIRLDNARVNE